MSILVEIDFKHSSLPSLLFSLVRDVLIYSTYRLSLGTIFVILGFLLTSRYPFNIDLDHALNFLGAFT